MAVPLPLATQLSRGLAWTGLASSLIGILDLVAIVVILGFWIDDAQYGIATKAVWIFPILDQATDLGLSAAVIQRAQHDDDTISTVFWINVTLALLLFGALLLVAPILATGFYGEAVIGWMLIAYGTKLLWRNVYFIPAALMKRELRWKELSIIRVVANLAELAGKVGFAAAGLGVWCFILGPLCRVLVTGVGCQLRHPWRPRWVFAPRKAWGYVTFGLKSSGSQILFHLYTNIDYPIVGFFFGNAALGAYRLAYEIVLEPVRMISAVVVDVAFPTFARLRGRRDRLIAQLVSFTRLNLVTVMTFAAVVFVTADDLVALAFPSYPTAAVAGTVRILAGVAVLRSVSYVVPPLLDGIGHPARTLIYTATAALTLPLLFVAGAAVLGDRLGFRSVAVAWAVGYPIAFAVLLTIAAWTLRLPVRRFLRAVAGVPACLIAAAAAGFGVEQLVVGLPVAARLAVTAAAIVGVGAALLAYTQGLSVNAVRRALRRPRSGVEDGAGEAVHEPAAERDRDQ